MTTFKLPIVHFNDCYRVKKQKTKDGEIDVSQFHGLIESIRQTWTTSSDGQKEGLVLFSGDLFSPSTESSVTRGSHLVPVINTLAPDVALTGNHDFDFGYPHLSKLVQDCRFPWLLSNVQDVTTGKVPEHLKEFVVLEKCGLRIGFIGLIEKEWIETISSWPAEFHYMPMIETGLKLSELLRDPEGPHKCDLIIALTHCRLPNDILLARGLMAYREPPKSAEPFEIAQKPGVDILLGGHDHFYHVCKGIDDWSGFDRSGEPRGAEKDDGVLFIKSGTDFRELSSMTLEVIDAPTGQANVRRKIIQTVRGARIETTPTLPSSPPMDEVLKKVLSSVSDALSAPLCNSVTAWDCRSSVVRTDESAIGNWMADVLLHAYDASPCVNDGTDKGADAVLICGGTLRGDNIHGPGIITLGDVMEILPFEDPIVVIEVDGQTIWSALEAALGKWPAQEGRFPIVSGLRVEWDCRRPPGQRVIGVWLTEEVTESDRPEDRHTKDTEPVLNEAGRTYKLVTREYMAGGFDGFVALKGKKHLIDDENGLTMSTIIRRFLLGSQYIHVMKTLKEPPRPLNESTRQVISTARTRHEHIVQRWKDASRKAIAYAHSRKNINEALDIGCREHMSGFDVFDGDSARCGKETAHKTFDDLVTVKPVIDGRFKNLGKEEAS